MSNTLIRKVAHYLTAPVNLGAPENWRREPGDARLTGGQPSTGSRTAAPERNPYVGSEVLEHFQHAFDAEELWRSARTQTGLRGGLRAVINAHPHMGDRRLPTSIVLELPEELIEHDNRIGGNSVDTLLAGLTELYLKDNKDRLKGGELPRFAAVTAADLPPNQIRVRMGAAIYVPGEDDNPAWTVQSSLDGTIWARHNTYSIPSGQRLWILGGSPDYASAACVDWPFPCEFGVAVVARPDSAELQLSSEPLKELKIVFNTDLRCYVVTRAHKPAGQAWDGGDAGNGQEASVEPVLYLRTERLLPLALDCQPSRDEAQQASELRASKPQPGAAKATPSTPAPGRVQSETPAGAAEQPAPAPKERREPMLDAVTGGGWVTPPVDPDVALTLLAEPKSPLKPVPAALDNAATMLAALPDGPLARLSLDGIALQRPSNFASHGVKGLQFGVSALGSVVQADSPLRAFRFDVLQSDEVRVTTASGTRSLTLGDPLPLARGKQQLELKSLPKELTNYYIGWLRLPLGEPVTLVRGQTIGVGRQMEALQPLKPLAGTGFLAQVPDLTGDQMGMSRKHFELQANLADDGSHLVLEVRPLGANTVVALDEQMEYVGTATADQPIKLLPGHCLVVGHYVWRFSETAKHAT